MNYCETLTCTNYTSTNFCVDCQLLVIFDLDHTLVSSTLENIVSDYTFMGFSMHVRPGAQKLIEDLQSLSNVRVGVWTAASKDYCDEVVKRLFLQQPPFFVRCYDHCSHIRIQEGLTSSSVQIRKRIKNIRNVNLKRTLIIDDTPSTYADNYGNAIPISSWEHGDNSNNNTLSELFSYLNSTFVNNKYDVRYIAKDF
jgi:TFIIF-interacting CTD phosphatase-like protein